MDIDPSELAMSKHNWSKNRNNFPLYSNYALKLGTIQILRSMEGGGVGGGKDISDFTTLYYGASYMGYEIHGVYRV